MITDPKLLIDKVFIYYGKQVNFLEDYYSSRLGYKIKISLDYKAQTSYFSLEERAIKISAQNLLAIMVKMPKLFYSLFYTLLLHEIGHGIYTDSLPYTDTTNILEDNRIEHQIEKWNTRVKFRLFRFTFQDLAFRQSKKIQNKTELQLAFLRTIDNSEYIKQIGNTPERQLIIKQILMLNDLYKSKDYELRKETTRIHELVDISKQVSVLFDKLIESWNEDKEKEQQEKQDGKGETEDKEKEPQKSDQSENQETDQEDDSEGDKEKEEGEQPDKEPEGDQETDQDEEQKEGNEPVKPSGGLTEQEKQELEEELSKIFQQGKAMEEELDNGLGKLHNPQPDTRPYEQFKISAFTTARRTGIKGADNVTRHAGSAKQLSLKKYARKDYVSNEKKFEVTNQEISRGGKNAKVVFYLDISGSMSGMKIETSVNYLKSFYDQMNKHLDIRFMAFGENTYELTRNELDFDFLQPRLEGSTNPQPIKLKPHEEIIFITDGGFGTTLPDQYMRKAHFVLVDVNTMVRVRNFGGMKHVYEVRTNNITEGLEKATKHIREMLKG